jgi:hypothetical protein
MTTLFLSNIYFYMVSLPLQVSSLAGRVGRSGGMEFRYRIYHERNARRSAISSHMEYKDGYRVTRAGLSKWEG